MGIIINSCITSTAQMSRKRYDMHVFAKKKQTFSPKWQIAVLRHIYTKMHTGA